MSDQKRIDAVIDSHPLNGRYGFTREDVIRQLQGQAITIETMAVASSQRGARKMMVNQQDASFIASLALAALATPQEATDDH